MENLNLVRDLDEKNKYLSNLKNEKFALYLDLVENFFKEYNNSKYRLNHNYYINESGNFEKKNIETEETTIIKKPKYFNIEERLEELDKQIGKLGIKLKKQRDKLLLDENEENKSFFDKLKLQYEKIEEERNKIIEYISRIERLDERIEKKKEIKQSVQKLNLEQYELKNEIDEHCKNREVVEMKEVIKKYLANNKSINNHLKKVIEIDNETQEHKFIIEEVYENTTKSVKEKKKKKFKIKKKEKKVIKETKEIKETIIKNKDQRKDLTKIKSPEFIEESDDEEPTISEKKEEPKVIEKKEEPKTSEKKEEPKTSEKELDVEELNLGDDLEELYNYQEDFKGSSDEDDDEDYVFNKSSKKDVLDESDKNIPIDFEQDIKDKQELKKKLKQKKSSNLEIDPDIDIEKISKEINKKVKDPNIKIIKVDPNLQFSNISSKTCDDSKDIRSDIETTDIAEGKKRRKKNMDPELKNCIFPYKEIQGQGKGKKKKEVMINECVSDGLADKCATERNPDCTTKKWAYCKK